MSGSITALEAFEITLPLPKQLQLGEIVIPHREYTIVRVHDGDGFVGTAYALSRNAPVAATVRKTIAPLWEKQPLADYDALYTRAVKANVPLGTNGIFWRALSLADCAIYDLLAQRAKQPLYAYLGGQYRITPTILVGGYPLPEETTESLRREIEFLAAYKPAGIKIGSASDYARDTERLRTCRQAMPDGPPLMIDLYWNATDATALASEAQKWGPLRMGWIEDPFPFDDFASMTQLAAALPFPVAVGDEQSGARHLERLMDDGGVGVLRLDATVCGGVKAFIDICAQAAARNIPVSSHVYHHLHTHLAAAVPNVKWVESILPELGLESSHLVWASDLPWQDDGLGPSQAPGVGYQWDEDALRYYRRK